MNSLVSGPTDSSWAGNFGDHSKSPGGGRGHQAQPLTGSGRPCLRLGDNRPLQGLCLPIGLTEGGQIEGHQVCAAAGVVSPACDIQGVPQHVCRVPCKQQRSQLDWQRAGCQHCSVALPGLNKLVGSRIGQRGPGSCTRRVPRPALQIGGPKSESTGLVEPQSGMSRCSKHLRQSIMPSPHWHDAAAGERSGGVGGRHCAASCDGT